MPVPQMMTRRWLAGCFLFLGTVPVAMNGQAPAVNAQAPAMNAQGPATGAPASVGGQAQLHVVVTPGRDGAPVPNLPQSAFTVLDNGRPQPITSFRAVAGNSEPVHVALVLDAVNVPYTQLAFERQQVESYLKSGDGKLPQPTSLAVVTDTGTQAMPGYTTDGNALHAALAKQEIGLRDLRRSSGFYGAEDRLDVSLRSLNLLVQQMRATPGRKAIVWLSPGWPILSGPNIQLSTRDQDRIFQQVQALTNELAASNITLYAVNPLGAGTSVLRTFYYEEYLKGVRKPGETQLGDLSLQVLATHSGGLVLNSSNDVKGLIARCVRDTTAFYEVSYALPPTEGSETYHGIEVKVGQPGLTARTQQVLYGQAQGGLR